MPASRPRSHTWGRPDTAETWEDRLVRQSWYWLTSPVRLDVILSSTIVVLALPRVSFPGVTVVTVATAKVVAELAGVVGRISTRSPALTAEDVPASTTLPPETVGAGVEVVGGWMLAVPWAASVPGGPIGGVIVTAVDSSKICGCWPGPGLLCTWKPAGRVNGLLPVASAARVPVAPIPGRGR